MSGRIDRYQVFATSSGHAAIAWNACGISAVRLPAETPDAATRSLLRRLPDAVRTAPPPAIADAIATIQRYFAGERVEFSDLPIDLGAQDPLFARIYEAVRRLGWGETSTYGAIARSVGEGPQLARAVGRAMAANPLPLIIPCHRVLAAGGKVGGFSAPGGADSKTRMLALEGIDLSPPPPAQHGFAF